MVLRTRWLIILGCTLVVTGVVAFLTYRQTPIYTAQSAFYLSANPDDSGNVDPLTRTSSPRRTWPGTSPCSVLLWSWNRCGSGSTWLRAHPSTPVRTSPGTPRSSRPRSPTRTRNVAAAIANAVGPQLADSAEDFSVLLRESGTTIVSKEVTPATVPGSPTSPVPSRNLALGLLAGLLVGIGIAFVRHTLDTKVREEADIRPFSTEPMLGGAPHGQGQDRPGDDRPRPSQRLRRGHPAVADQPHVRRHHHGQALVHRDLGDAGRGQDHHHGQPRHGDGHHGWQVLLIDGDLRNPSVARTLGIEGGAGLTTVLLGQAGVNASIQRWRDTSLHVLTAGAIPPNPSELLGSEPMRELFDKLAHEFDFILIDSPPVDPVVDAVLLDRLTGGTLMVVASHKTKKRDLASAIKQLDTVGAKLVGFALNFVPVSESDARRYGYYRFQETPSSTAAAGKPQKPSRAKPRADAKGLMGGQEGPTEVSRLARSVPRLHLADERGGVRGQARRVGKSSSSSAMVARTDPVVTSSCHTSAAGEPRTSSLTLSSAGSRSTRTRGSSLTPCGRGGEARLRDRGRPARASPGRRARRRPRGPGRHGLP